MEIKKVGDDSELSGFDPKNMSEEDIAALQDAFATIGLGEKYGIFKTKRGFTKVDHAAPKQVAKRKTKRKAAKKARKMTAWHKKKDKKNLRNR